MKTQTAAAGLAALALLLAAAPARAADGPPLDQALAEQAPRLLKALKDKGVTNLGVLKFLVGEGDGPLKDDAGTFNRTLADRLEVALILANPDDPKQQVGVYVKASDAVAKLDLKLNHLDAKSRPDFFEMLPDKFQPAWIGMRGGPDAFVTGKARVSPDLRSVKVTVQAFLKGDPKQMVEVASFDAGVDARTLDELGKRYVSPLARGGTLNRAQIEQIAKADRKELNPDKTNPRPDDSDKDRLAKLKALDEEMKTSPVQLEVLYNGKPAALVYGEVRTPQKGDKVAFRLTNTDDRIPYAVALLINGQNTIDPERTGDPKDLRKWILRPGKSIVIDAFQKGDDKGAEFEVLPPEQSAQGSVSYGDNAGLITMTVFRGVADKMEEALLVKLDLKQPDKDARIVSRGMSSLPGIKSGDLKALKGHLRDELEPKLQKDGARGLIEPGRVVDSSVKVEKFDFIPGPVVNGAVRYYKKGE